MRGTVDQLDLKVDDREARERPRVHGRLDAPIDGGNVFFRQRATNDAALERVALARLGWRNDQLDAGELARTAGLRLVGIADFGLAADGLAIGDLGLANIEINAEFLD